MAPSLEPSALLRTEAPTVQDEIWQSFVDDAQRAQAEDRVDDAENALLAAVELSENSSISPLRRAETHSRLSILYAGSERNALALEHGTRALATVEEAFGADDVRLLPALAHLTLVILRSREGDVAPLLTRMIELLEARTDDVALTPYSAAATGIAEILVRHPELDPRTEKLLRIGLADFERLGGTGTPQHTRASALLAGLRYRAGAVDEAVVTLARSIDALGEDGEDAAVWSVVLGSWLIQADRPAEAEPHLRFAARSFAREGDRAQEARARYHLAFVRNEAGAHAEAEAILRELQGRMGDPEGEARVLRELAHALRETDRGAEADELLARADALFPEPDDEDD